MKFFCLHCGQKLGVPTLYTGRNVRCPACGNEQAIPPQDVVAQENTGIQPIPDPQHPPADLDHSVGFREKEQSADVAPSSPSPVGNSPEPGLRAIPDSVPPSPSPNPEAPISDLPAEGLRAISELKQTLQSNKDTHDVYFSCRN